MTRDDEFLEELKSTFLEELDDTLDQIEAAFLRFEKNPQDKEILHEIFRYFHNTKGSSKTVGMKDLSHFAHQAENLLAKLRNSEIAVTDDISDCLLLSADVMRSYAEKYKNGEEDSSKLIEQARLLENFLNNSGSGSIEESPPVGDQKNEKSAEGSEFGFFTDHSPSTQESVHEVHPKPPINQSSTPTTKQTKRAEEYIKVPMNKINDILNLFGEQVILQSALDHEMDSENIDMDYISKSVGQLKKITQDLQHTMVTLRMVSLENLFNRMERSVRDVSRITGKKIEFVTVGKNAELDKSIVDALIDPLTHMVRNAVDHGIETGEERIKLSKPEHGTVTLSAQRAGGAFEIVVEDDGRGLNKDKILAKAKEKGLVNEGTKLADNQIFELIFASGFSTIENATEISGRGVGMDVVRQQIRALKGVCNITSELGKGTKFTIRVPLSLAMFNGTIVSINGQRYVVPNSDFLEALTVNPENQARESGVADVIDIGGRVLRTIDLRQSLSLGTSMRSPTRSGKLFAIVAEHEDQQYALLVNNILSQEQIVLKELGPEAKQVRGTSGGTILGDGKVALVLDVTAIIKRDRIVSTARAV